MMNIYLLVDFTYKYVLKNSHYTINIACSITILMWLYLYSAHMPTCNLGMS